VDSGRVAPSDEGAPGPGEARLLASGVILQQIAQASGLVALLAIVTILARQLSVAELGAYGLVASLAGYLLVLRNSVAASAVRALASALDSGDRARMFSAAAALYAAVGIATGLLIGVAALLIAALILEGDLARDARLGGIGLGLVTAVGIAASIYLDALRAERLFVRAATTEIAAVCLYLAMMLVVIFAGAGLATVIAVSGAMPLFSGVLSALVVRRRSLPFWLERDAVTRERAMAIVPTAGYLLIIELCNLAMYAFQRIILGAFTAARTVGLYEGPLRAHNLFYALNGALAVPVVPTASRYAASEDVRRLRELVLRGTRYTLALFVPLCVTLMVMAEPILDVWLGDRYGDGAAALTILVSYWLLYGGLVVTPGFLVGAGAARYVARIFVLVAGLNLVLSLALTPALGLEGPAFAAAIPFALAFPVMLALGLRAGGGVRLGELARRAWQPAYSLGAALGATLIGLRLAADPETLPAVLAACAGGVLAYWLAFYALTLSPDERVLVRSLVSRSR
jgi:O-antigen/teichoic acid export membrane protein